MAAPPLDSIRDPDRRREPRTWLGALGVLIAAGAFGVAAGPFGLLAGGALVALWYVLPTPYVLAIGHLLLIALFQEPASPTLPQLALVELGLLGVLLNPLPTIDAPLRVASATIGTFALLVGVVAAGLWWFDALWLTALVLGGTAAFLAYGIHRYERLHLGLIDTTADTTADTNTDTTTARMSNEEADEHR